MRSSGWDLELKANSELLRYLCLHWNRIRNSLVTCRVARRPDFLELSRGFDESIHCHAKCFRNTYMSRLCSVVWNQILVDLETLRYKIMGYLLITIKLVHWTFLVNSRSLFLADLAIVDTYRIYRILDQNNLPIAHAIPLRFLAAVIVITLILWPVTIWQFCYWLEVA